MTTPLLTSVPMMERTTTLKSLHAIKIFRRFFNRFEYNFYLSSILVRVRGKLSNRFHDEITQVEAHIGTFLDEAIRELDAQGNAITVELEVAGVDLSQTAHLVYRQPLEVIAKPRTPRANRLFDAICALDGSCQRLDLAFFNEYLSAEDIIKRPRKLAQILVSLSGRVHTLAQGLAREVVIDESTGTVHDPSYQALLNRQAVPTTSEDELAATLDSDDESELPADPDNLLDQVVQRVASEEKDGDDPASDETAPAEPPSSLASRLFAAKSA